MKIVQVSAITAGSIYLAVLDDGSIGCLRIEWSREGEMISARLFDLPIEEARSSQPFSVSGEPGEKP